MKTISKEQLEFMDAHFIADVNKFGGAFGRDADKLNEERYRSAERAWGLRNKLYKVI